jgi:quercetin dioxygenase-like cupin family protein
MICQTLNRILQRSVHVQSRKWHRAWSALIIVLAFCLSSSLALGQAQPPGPVVKYQFRTQGQPQPTRFHLVHNLLHFDPGAATPLHRHPGQVLVTVLEGENTLSVNGVEKVYKAGESFVEVPGEVYQGRNTGTSRMSVMVTYLLPWEAPLSQPEPQDTTPPPRPFVSYQFKTDVQPMTDPFDVVQLVQDFAPGAATPFHTHPGIVVVTVVSGELTFWVNGAEKVYKEGESFVEVPNQVARARNVGTATTRVMASLLIPAGAPLSNPQRSPATPAALPQTGEGEPHALTGWLLLIAVIGFFVGGWLRWRQRASL